MILIPRSTRPRPQQRLSNCVLVTDAKMHILDQGGERLTRENKLELDGCSSISHTFCYGVEGNDFYLICQGLQRVPSGAAQEDLGVDVAWMAASSVALSKDTACSCVRLCITS